MCVIFFYDVFLYCLDGKLCLYVFYYLDIFDSMYYEIKTKQSYKDLTFCELKKTQTHDSCYFLCDSLNGIYNLMFTGFAQFV